MQGIFFVFLEEETSVWSLLLSEINTKVREGYSIIEVKYLPAGHHTVSNESI